MDQEGSASMAIMTAEIKAVGDRLNLLNVNQPILQEDNVGTDNPQVDNVNNSGTINTVAGEQTLGT